MIEPFRTIFQSLFPFLSGVNPVEPDNESNPLTVYYRFFTNQHKMITVLYKTLIINFGVFLLLVTLFLYNIDDNPLMPDWGRYVLVVIDFFLAFGVYKSFIELDRYKKKNQEILKMVEEKLGANLKQLKKIQNELGELEHLTSSNLTEKVEYTGWDMKICPKCGAKAEMLATECSHCHAILTPTLPC